VETILFALWFFAPAGAANGSPVFANKVPILSKLGMPIDGGKTFRGKRIFGDHKTVRGFVVGTLTGLVIAGLQILLYANFSWVADISGSVDYSNPAILLMGAMMGFGALAGDSIKSFFKRQFSVPSGQSWFPYDQVDYIIGGILFSLPFVLLPLSTYVVITIIWFLIHPVATLVGWLLKLKDTPI
jgi:CDP-2,3-bis-(O-geranylgeranyl)-sn-glycerol synthase